MDEHMETLRKNLLSAIDAYIEGAFERHYKQEQERQHAAFEAWHNEVIRSRQIES